MQKKEKREEKKRKKGRKKGNKSNKEGNYPYFGFFLVALIYIRDCKFNQCLQKYLDNFIFSAGMMLGGGCGDQLAKWIVNGRPELDMYG